MPAPHCCNGTCRYVWAKSYQSIEDGAGIGIGEVGQPNIQVTLGPPAHCLEGQGLSKLPP